ncbi:MAG: 1-deoxy-D-xylulose-5-phosphate synthase [Planctomycetes bacterium]|jgi:1-deoxy-D-xylulose-5-phosphate synthase|nr:1-deoxy-D-xylulose-5-phosphate synthase [Planctomycetota bacterium]MCL4730258.1 1-deoxy-D-xylulose-5-phosphate synthase [Planctomycetota bacterium]
MSYPLLEQADTPQGLKQLDARDLPKLAQEMRAFIIDSVSGRTGGHLGSGLGAVELTIALHYHYNLLDHDSVVFDVGHQCYPHKLLTGRRGQFGTLRQYHGISGFPDPKESPYDRVKTGHGGTSLSTALGIAIANKQLGRDDRTSIAVIGDGALQEGQALEALNHGGDLRDLKYLVILNDNEHGIGPATGALASYFSKFRTSHAYTAAKRDIKRVLKSLEESTGSVGRALHDVLDHVKAGMHGLMPATHPGVLFEELGYFYYGPIDGHDIEALLEAFENVSRIPKPVLLHVLTKKGKGFKDDIPDHYAYHAAKTSSKLTAHLPKEYARTGGLAYTDVFVEKTLDLMARDPKVVAITAAMLQGTGLEIVQKKYPERVFDVGMAEQHAVGFAQGLKMGGMKPICAIYSTFLQRSVDQLFQELALIKLPVLLALDRAGLVGPDGATHNGVFDIAYISMLPNFVVMAPRDATELRKMMEFGLELGLPSAVRFPRTNSPRPDAELPDAQPIELGRAEILRQGDDGVVFAYGAMVYHALEALELIEERWGRRLTLINARFAKPLDETLFAPLIESMPVVFTVEEHVRRGGFGSHVLEFANRARLDANKIEILAIEDRFVDHGARCEVLSEVGLDPAGIAAAIEKRMGLRRSAPRTDSRRNVATGSSVAG